MTWKEYLMALSMFSGTLLFFMWAILMAVSIAHDLDEVEVAYEITSTPAAVLPDPGPACE